MFMATGKSKYWIIASSSVCVSPHFDTYYSIGCHCCQRWRVPVYSSVSVSWQGGYSQLQRLQLPGRARLCFISIILATDQFSSSVLFYKTFSHPAWLYSITIVLWLLAIRRDILTLRGGHTVLTTCKHCLRRVNKCKQGFWGFRCHHHTTTNLPPEQTTWSLHSMSSQPSF